jgi:hypothetical protein
MQKSCINYFIFPAVVVLEVAGFVGTVFVEKGHMSIKGSSEEGFFFL